MVSSLSRFAYFKRQFTGLLVIILIVSWASILTYQTVEIQGSSDRLVGWDKVEICHNVVSPSSRTNENSSEEPSTNTGDGTTPSHSHIGMVIGPVTVLALALIGAPIVVAAGVGIATWITVDHFSKPDPRPGKVKGKGKVEKIVPKCIYVWR